MIQFNLLPDVKQEFIKARRLKRTVIIAAGTIGGFSFGIFVLLFLIVNVVQKKHLSDLNNDIKKYSQQLQNTPDLNKILTIQNQLNSLPGLQTQKVVASRLPGFLGKVTPSQASIDKLKIDFTAKTININGTADSLSTVNKFADTLKFTKFITSDSSSQKNAFDNVVLSNFNRESLLTTYNLTFSFDGTIFDNDATVHLIVPKIITTRSETEKPNQLFQSSSSKGGQ